MPQFLRCLNPADASIPQMPQFRRCIEPVAVPPSMLPGWHHAVISHAPLRRNLAVNAWYDLQSKTVPLERVSSLNELFQTDGCS